MTSVLSDCFSVIAPQFVMASHTDVLSTKVVVYVGWWKGIVSDDSHYVHATPTSFGIQILSRPTANRLLYLDFPLFYRTFCSICSILLLKIIRPDYPKER